MKKTNAFFLYALATPTFVLGALSVNAQSQPATSGAAQEARAENQAGSMSRGMLDGQTAEHAGARHLAGKPMHGFHSDELIGTTLTKRSSRAAAHTDAEEIGKVSDLVLDQHGQIVAVIVDTGGFLGMNQRSVAVSWDSIERSQNTEDDSYTLEADVSEDALKDAPEYNRD